MFNCIRRYFNNRHRAIFKFWDGSRWRFVDPLPAFRNFLGHSLITPEHLAILERPTELPQELALEYFDCVVKATRDVFKVTEFDGDKGTGLTTAETRDLITDFMAYMVSLKKSGNPTPTLPPPTTVPAKSSEPIPNTNVSSDSHSIPSESKYEEPPGCC